MIEIRADGCLVRVAGVVGYQHENNRAQIRIPLDDVLDIVRDNPGGSYAVVYKRMFDEQFYTSTDYELDGAYLIWNVSSHVVAVRGDLEVQIVYSTDQQIAETQIYHFKVARGLMEDEEGQGENLSDLIEQALLAAGTVDQAIYDAQQTLDEKVTAAQAAQTAAEAAQTAAERAQHTAENAKTSAAQSANAAYNFAADANTAKRDATNAKDAAVQAKGAAETAKTAAETAKAAADADALKAEGYAVGTQNGTPAAEGQPYYQDNAKYYKEQAAAAKTAAEAARDTAQQTVAGIEAAGTAQVQRVTAEGATQVSNVQTKGQQVLDSIPDDYSELSAEVGDLKSALHNLLATESQIGDAVTLSNIVSSNAVLPRKGGLNTLSGSDLTAAYTCAAGAEVSPYAYKSFEKSTSGKYLWGFKYRLTKLDPLLENPENIRMHMGDSTYFDDPVVYNEWINFAEIATVNLTRIRFAIRNFPTAPTEDSFKFETKEMYLYDVTNVNTSMIEYIIEEQKTNYKDGTVTYGDAAEYHPDTSLSIRGKVADSKAVGDAVSPLAASVSQLLSDVSALNDSVDIIESGVDGIVETATATLTDLNPNANIFTSGVWRYISTVDGVLSFVPNNPSDADVYGSNICNLGEGKYLVGFKYRLSKIDSLLDDPQSVRVILGSGTSGKKYTYTNFEYNDWSEFAEIADVDLTRVYFSVCGFPTPPTASQFKLEIKDYYIYNIDSVDSRLYDIIIDQQNESYKSGTVIYSSGFPSKDIVNSEIQINVKSFGVKGDGVTDDTNAINAVFSKMKGNFYFPEGTYKISGTISLPSEATMFGDGDKTIIDMYSCDNLTQCVFRGGNSIYPYILVGNNNKLHDFKLIGNNTTQERRHSGILVMDAENCFISNLTIYNINYFASQTDPNVNAYGICVLRSYRVYIDHCYVEQCGYECIGIADSSHHCVVSNCITKNGWRTCIQVHRGAYDVDIIGNQMIQDAQAWDACFTLHGLQDGYLVRNLRIENNTFKATVPPRTRNEAYASVVQLMSYCDGLWFVNNRVEAGDRNLAAEESITHLIMIGNLFQCNDTSDYRIRIVSEYPIIVGNALENTDGTTQRISATAVKVANIGFD